MGPAAEEIADRTLVSVRSQVERVVDPDGAVITGQISLTRENKSAALQAAAVALDGLKADLSKLGGVPLTAQTAREGLTWSTQRVSTMPEFTEDRRTKTGRMTAAVFLQLELRNFDVLSDLESLMAEADSFVFFNARWYVDADNQVWKEVRAEAITEALHKGDDYAKALGSHLLRVEHISDTGLIGRETAPTLLRGAAAMGGGAGGATTPSLDPVPQALIAQIEARFQIAPVALPR